MQYGLDKEKISLRGKKMSLVRNPG